MSLHKCCIPIIAEKPGGLKEIRTCGKSASIKKPGGGFICAQHALQQRSRK